MNFTDILQFVDQQIFVEFCCSNKFFVQNFFYNHIGAHLQKNLPRAHQPLLKYPLSDSQNLKKKIEKKN